MSFGRRATMRLWWRSVAWVVCFAVPCPAQPDAPGSTPHAEPPQETLTEARRHFDNGIKLFHDENYAAALAEFEATYALKPGASSLQNIALCQKALFRYADAAQTLARLLDEHASELSEVERNNVRAALQELTALTRRVVFRVTPADATLSIDGIALSAGARSRGVVLNVGEHQVSASAPGYASQTLPVRVASGRAPAIIELRLEPTAGFVTVVTQQKAAAIAIDGQALEYDHWSGPLEPGEHVLQIYKPGHETVEEIFEVDIGETKLIRASAGGELEESSGTVDPAGPTPKLVGWYGLGAFNLMLVPDEPDGVDVKNSLNGGGAMSWGGRAGYRLLTPLAVELLLEGGLTSVTDACIDEPSNPNWRRIEGHSCSEGEAGLAYEIWAFRLGGNVRAFSSGRRARFASTLGFGAVQHRFELERTVNDDSLEAAALNAYVLVEIGVQFNLQRFLLEADFVTYVESRGAWGEGQNLFNEGGLKSLGIGLKAGWGEWSNR